MTTLANIITEGLKLIDPTVKGIDLIESLTKYAYERNINKIDEINKKLLNDTASDYEKEKILSGGINEEDYLSFIRAAVNDDETKKTPHYITLYRNILNGKITEEKGRLYKILKELPYSALEMLSKIYVHKHFKVQNKTLEKYIQELTSNDTLSFEVNLLIQYGLLKNIQLTGGLVPSDSNVKISSNFDSIVELFFKKDELTPKSQKIRVWNKKTFLLADLEDMPSFNYVQNLLHSETIQVGTNHNLFALNRFIHLKVDSIVCLLNNKTIPNEAIKILEKYSSMYKIHKICLDEIVEDQLHTIQGDLILIEKENQQSEQFFLSKFNTDPMDLF